MWSQLSNVSLGSLVWTKQISRLWRKACSGLACLPLAPTRAPLSVLHACNREIRHLQIHPSPCITNINNITPQLRDSLESHRALLHFSSLATYSHPRSTLPMKKWMEEQLEICIFHGQETTSTRLRIAFPSASLLAKRKAESNEEICLFDCLLLMAL